MTFSTGYQDNPQRYVSKATTHCGITSYAVWDRVTKTFVSRAFREQGQAFLSAQHRNQH
jgi:hypothetical protein